MSLDPQSGRNSVGQLVHSLPPNAQPPPIWPVATPAAALPFDIRIPHPNRLLLANSPSQLQVGPDPTELLVGLDAETLEDLSAIARGKPREAVA